MIEKICDEIVITSNELITKSLQEENEILKENAEHNDKVVDKVNWENMWLKKKIAQLKNNWTQLKEYLINDINDRNGHKVAEYEDGGKVSETISPIYTLMEDKSKTMKEVLDKMQELEQESDE